MKRPWLLLVNVLLVAGCGLTYELLAATVASYLLGDSVFQFSIIIGLYLSAMGVGAWLSGFVVSRVAKRFIEIETTVGLLGGLSAPLLFLLFAKSWHFSLALYLIVFCIGTLVGLEIPLLMRLLKDRLEFRDLVSRVLMFDYLGALLASVLFPMLLVPYVGLVRTSLLIGLVNVFIALWASALLEDFLESTFWLRARAVFAALVLGCGLVYAENLTERLEQGVYANPIVYARSTPYQRIVVTQGRNGFQLFLNGHLQFHSGDEYRYHEALVHPALLAHGAPKRVLILGGGDGLALREVLRHPGIEHVTLCDLDKGMTDLARTLGPLRQLNGDALADPRVTVVNRDAFLWLDDETAAPGFDVALVDFPDPSRYEVGKLYTTRFYRMLRRRLNPGGTVAVQSTSPLLARKSFWCVARTIESTGLHIRPYQAAVPSFGVWGFVLAKAEPFDAPDRVPAGMGLRYLSEGTLRGLFEIPPDMAALPVEINRPDNQVLVRYYDSEWRALE